MSDNPTIYFNINERSKQKELLDEEEAIDAEALSKNLNEFIALNQYFGSKSTLIQALDKVYDVYRINLDNQDAHDLNAKIKKLTIVDLGSGAGDLLD